jgi:hypothetical protein
MAGDDIIGTLCEDKPPKTANAGGGQSKSKADGKFAPVWEQEVRDESGRRRLHGAFTGGFSAGYFNTVGSKEGWTPQTFVSSRKVRHALTTYILHLNVLRCLLHVNARSFVTDTHTFNRAQARASHTERTAEDYMDEEDIKEHTQVSSHAHSHGHSHGNSHAPAISFHPVVLTQLCALVFYGAGWENSVCHRRL